MNFTYNLRIRCKVIWGVLLLPRRMIKVNYYLIGLECKLSFWWLTTKRRAKEDKGILFKLIRDKGRMKKNDLKEDKNGGEGIDVTNETHKKVIDFYLNMSVIFYIQWLK